jgi:hypothetical protein
MLKHCAVNRKRRLSALPNVGPYIYDVKISGFTRSSIYIYIHDISRLRVKSQRIRWLGNIERMQDTAIPKKMHGKLYATRRRGRPKTRWLDDVSTDLRNVGINEWRGRARDCEAWRRIVMEAKVHPGL